MAQNLSNLLWRSIVLSSSKGYILMLKIMNFNFKSILIDDDSVFTNLDNDNEFIREIILEDNLMFD